MLQSSSPDGSPHSSPRDLHGRGQNRDRHRVPPSLRNETSTDTGQIVSLGAVEKSPLQVLHLNKEVLLDDRQRRFIYRTVHFIARTLPFLAVYGGTLGLVVCALCQYRWGVLLSLTLYSFYMLHLSISFCIFSIVGLFKVSVSMSENWHEKFCRLRERQLNRVQDDEKYALTLESEMAREVGWQDVIHVVLIPTYKTPIEVLETTVRALAQYAFAETNVAVCLAFEEREVESAAKARSLKETFKGNFRFILATYHPPNLPNHVPGKSSNECWAFFQLARELSETHGISCYDRRVLITIADDDSEFHEKYLEALTYQFLTTEEHARYMTTWQPPICHFKNYLRQPLIVRISSLFATLHELSCLANPLDCHVPFSSYSLSLVLASAVGGWDPEYLAEDWHMFAKCSLMTEGRTRCQPIFLPLLNYTPEEETYFGTVLSRWSQAKRHALGVSELVYVISSFYLAFLELPTPKRLAVFLWRLAPLTSKMAQVHFNNGMSCVWNVLAQLVIHFYMWQSWCYLSDLSDTDGIADGTCVMAGDENDTSLADAHLLMNSFLVYWQQRATALTAFVTFLAGGLGAFYFHLVKDRVEGNVDANWKLRNMWIMWPVLLLEVSVCGLLSAVVFGAAPLWIACVRIIQTVTFPATVAGMVGRSHDSEAL